MTEFELLVLKNLRLVPRGKVTTYQSLAWSAGVPRGARAVGNAVNKNPDAPIVPCHRVVYSDGRLGGYAHGSKIKIDLLAEEGVEVRDGKIVNFKEIFFDFDNK
jgi:methylated-DNA-[protein]-cysteine S-methyltransferase